MVRIITLTYNCPDYNNSLQADLRYVAADAKQLPEEVIPPQKKKEVKNDICTAK